MSLLDTLTEEQIQPAFSKSQLRQGYDLVGFVLDCARQGDTLTATVSARSTEQVRVLAEGSQILAACTCHYDWAGHCKHIAAVLLKWLDAPQDFETVTGDGQPRPPATPESLVVDPVEPPAPFKPDALPDWVARAREESRQADLAELAKELESHRLEDLRERARGRGWTLRGTRKGDVALQLAERMSDPDAIARGLAKFDTEHRLALAVAALLGDWPGLSRDDMERAAGKLGVLKRYKQLSTYIGHLADELLLVPPEPLSPYSYARPPASVPRALLRVMPPLLADAVFHAPERPVGQQVEDVRLGSALSFVRSLKQLLAALEIAAPPLRPPQPRPRIERFFANLRDWDYVPDEIFRAERSGSLARYAGLVLTVPPPQMPLPDDATARMAPLAGDAGRLEFMLALLTQLGLVLSGSPVTTWPEVRDTFLRRPEAAQHALLARTYFDLAGWSEVWPIVRANPDLRVTRVWNAQPPTTPLQLHQDLLGYRQFVLRALSLLPQDEWLRVDDVLSALRAVWWRFDQGARVAYTISDPRQSGWYISRSGQPLRSDSEEDWRAAQGAFVLEMLRGPLHWLGLADLYAPQGDVTHVRLRGLADLYLDRLDTVDIGSAAALGVAAEAATNAADALRLEGDAIAVDPARLGPEAHSLLDHVARLEDAQLHRFIYRLDPAALHQTFERGALPEELEAHWEGLFGAPMPAEVAHRVRTAWRQYGRVRLYRNVTLIEFGDDYALGEMKAATSLGRVMIAEISPRLVMIPRDAVSQLVAELEKAGYTPRLAEAS